MIIDSAKEVQSNVGPAKEFSFGSSASKLFQMLSSSLYSNKELAVIMEISANCLDAHKLVNKQHEPFEIILPTNLDPFITFRDFGPGLSEENVYNFLTRYGESSKQDSNEFIGGWGIGSKAPASVTDTWNIISKHDGILKEYIVFINEHSIPSIVKIREQETEEFGLDVIIPIKQDRFQHWHDIVSSSFVFYEVKPTVKNCKYALKENKNSWFKNENEYHFENSNYYNYTNIIVNQRSYNIDLGKVFSDFPKTEFYKTYLVKGMNLVMETGSVDLSISRESIQYTKKSIHNIMNKIDEFIAFFKMSIEAVDSNAVDRFDYAQKILDVLSNIECSHEHLQKLFESCKKNKFGLEYADLFVVDIPMGKISDNKIEENKLRQCLGGSIKAFNKMNYYRPSPWNIVQISTYKINSDEDIILTIPISLLKKLSIVINDTKNTSARIRNVKDSGKYFLISNTNFFPVELHKYVINASTLDLPEREKRTKQKVEGNYYIQQSPRISFEKVDKYNLKDFTQADTVCVIIDNVRSVNSAGMEYSKWANVLRRTQSNVVYVKKSEDNNLNFPGPEEFFTKMLNDYVKSAQYKTDCENRTIAELQLYAITYALKNQLLKTQNPNTRWNELSDKVGDLGSSLVLSSHFSECQEIAKALCITYEVKDQNLIDEVNTLRQKYSMFEYVKYYEVLSGSNQIIVDYLNLVNF